MGLEILERRRLKVDLELRPYKKIIEPAFSDDQKKNVCELASNKFSKILFSGEKLFDIDGGIYNGQNERVWAVDRADTGKKGDIKQKRKFPEKAMVWPSRLFQALVILNEGTVDHVRFIEKVLPVMVIKSLVTIRSFSKMRESHPNICF